jgi:hypothetical protein
MLSEHTRDARTTFVPQPPPVVKDEEDASNIQSPRSQHGVPIFQQKGSSSHVIG